MQVALQSDSETSSEAEASSATKMVRACMSLVVVLLQSSKRAQKLADVNHAITQALHILQPKAESSRPFLNDIIASIAALKSKLNLQIDLTV